ncbi:hypothetical protein TKK_0003488 [Trichogramma kaykai]
MSKHKRKRSSRSRDRSRDREERMYREKSNLCDDVDSPLEKRMKVVEDALIFLMNEAKTKKLAEAAEKRMRSSDLKENSVEEKTQDLETLEKSNEKKEPTNAKPLEITSADTGPTKDVVEVDDENEGPSLDPEILERMGINPTSKKIADHSFHPELVCRWNTWLSEGIPKEEKENILKLYSRQGSCNLEAPLLNEELVKAIPEATMKRDEHFRQTQNDIGSALSAVGSAISLILNEDTEIDKFDLLGKLFDAGGLLADTFHKHTKARKAYISPTLQSVKHVLKKTKSEKYLYGSKLVEAINNDKALDKLTQLVQTQKNQSRQNQENRKGPLVTHKQVGHYQNQGKRFLKFQPKQPSQWKQNRTPFAQTQRQAPYPPANNNRYNKSRK